MAKSSDSLFLLIRSMTKSEKRHFKLSMSGYQSDGDKHYLRLFDAIDAQKVYDEKAIKKKFAADVYFNQLARVKIYLYQQILKTLRNFYADASRDIQLNNYLTEIEVLFKKELYADCKERIRKAKLLAEKYEKLHHLLRLSQWEMVLADHISDRQEVEKVKTTAMAQQQLVLNQYQEYGELWGLYMKALSISLTAGQAGNKSELSQGDDIINHHLMKKKLSTVAAENLRLTVLVHHAYRKGDLEEMYRKMKLTVQLTETHSYLMEERLNSYFQNLGALAGICVSLYKLKEADAILKKLKTISAEHPHQINFKFRLSMITLEIDLLKKKGKFDEAVRLIPALLKETETGLKELEPLDEMLFYYCIFGAYFGKADYKNAQLYLQKIISSTHKDMLTNFLDHVRVINLLLQYEQGEYVHLGYLLRSTYRNLVKRKKMHQAEAVLIDFFKQSIKLTSTRQHTLALTGLKAKLLPLSRQPFERNLFADFPLLEWIDSKLQKKTLREVMKQRYTEEAKKE